MAYKEIEQAARAAFGDSENCDYAKDYLDGLRANWRELESKLGRMTTLMLIAAAIGEVAVHGNIAQFGIGGITIQSPSFLALWSPVIAAYLYLGIQDLLLTTTLYQDVHDAVMAQCFAPLHRPELDEAIYPPSVIGVPVATAYRGAGRAALKLVGVVRLLVLSLGLPIFLSIYYFQLVSLPHGNYIYISILEGYSRG